MVASVDSYTIHSLFIDNGKQTDIGTDSLERVHTNPTHTHTHTHTNTDTHTNTIGVGTRGAGGAIAPPHFKVVV